METVVLPAQDHLAQERYRQVGVMSGMIYPLGGLPRTRRKVRSPHQVFVAASLHSGPSEKSKVHVADSRSALVSPMDMSLGILRSAPLSASTSHLPPSSELKTPQYRLNNTTPHRLVSHESSTKKQQYQLAASLSTHAAVSSGVSVPSNQILRTRSDGVLGELLQQQQGLKRGVEDRKKGIERSGEGSKNSAADKTSEKNGEKSSERRKGLDRRPVEKKPAAVTSTSQGDKGSSSAQKKAGVITILQRPQTKEAAAENIALFNGKPIDDVATKQILKSAQGMSQYHAEQTAIEVELVKSVEVSGKDGEIDNVHSRSSRNASPKNGSKKKPSRDSSSKAASRAATAEGTQGEARKIQDSELHGESRRPKTAPRPAGNDSSERRRSDDSNRSSDELKGGVELDVSLEPNLYEMFKYPNSEFSPSHSTSSADELVSAWYDEEVVNIPLPDDGVANVPGVPHRGSSDSLVGEIGQALGRQGVISRSSSFRDASRGGNDSGAELFFLASSPPKPSERWAGPAYTNSPPPSTLPFPTFPLQRVKSSMTEVSLADMVLRGPLDTNVESVSSSSAPPSPTRVESLLFSGSAMQSPFVDASSATKDLRRILNLNVEDSFEVSLEWSEGGVESATQSLKRMLQLG